VHYVHAELTELDIYFSTTYFSNSSVLPVVLYSICLHYCPTAGSTFTGSNAVSTSSIRCSLETVLVPLLCIDVRRPLSLHR
jgi:hypothetical protein